MAHARFLLAAFVATVVADPFAVPIKQMQRTTTPDAAAPARFRRDTMPLSDPVDALHTLFVVNVTVGTPPQSMTLQVDTAGVDTWVTLFDPNASSTYTYENSEFRWQPASGPVEVGDVFSDVLTIGPNGPSLTTTMGYVVDGSADNFLGIFGLTYGRTDFANDAQYKYPSLLAQMVLDGILPTKAFSLWCGGISGPDREGGLHLPNHDGTLTFGGVDTSQFYGPLHATPIINPSLWQHQFINITGLSLVDGRGELLFRSHQHQFPVAMLLDTGTYRGGLPDDMWKFCYTYYGLQNWYNETGPQGRHDVPCHVSDDPGSFIYELSDINGTTFQIATPVSDVVSVGGYDAEFDSPLTYDNGSILCAWTPYSNGEAGEPVYAGVPFLRGVYTVHDLTANMVGLAPAWRGLLNPSNLVPITGPGSWAGVQGQPFF